MNARECMQALVDGKTLRRFDVFIKLDEDGDISVNGDTPDYRELGKLNFNADFWEVTEEYPLTFREAMQEAINGKKIVCKRRPERVYSFNPAGKLIEIGPWGSDIASIGDISINSKWRVVK